MAIKMLPRLVIGVTLIIAAIAMVSCGGSEPEQPSPSPDSPPPGSTPAPVTPSAPETGEEMEIEFIDTGSPPPMLADTSKKYTAYMETEKGTLVLELFAADVPLTVSNFVQAVQWAQSGKLGKLHTLHASIYRLRDSHEWLPAQPEPPKDVVDWDMWLGPAPWRPFNQRYVDGGWRGYFDFDSGATLHDWGAHTLDLCQWANQADDTTPIEFEPIDVPDDNAGGGTIIFDFDELVRVNAIDILDIDVGETGGTVKTFDASGNVISTHPIADLGDNSLQSIGIGDEGVSRTSL